MSEFLTGNGEIISYQEFYRRQGMKLAEATYRVERLERGLKAILDKTVCKKCHWAPLDCTCK